MIPAALIDAQPNERILDMCAVNNGIGWNLCLTKKTNQPTDRPTRLLVRRQSRCWRTWLAEKIHYWWQMILAKRGPSCSHFRCWNWGPTAQSSLPMTALSILKSFLLIKFSATYLVQETVPSASRRVRQREEGSIIVREWVIDAIPVCLACSLE